MSAVEYVVPNLGVFSQENFQIAITSNDLLKISPLSSLDSSTVIDFEIKANESYINFNELYLSVDAQLVKKDGSLYQSSDLKQPRLNNNFLYNIFKNAKVFVQNTQVLSIDNDLPILYFFESVLNFDSLVADSKLGCNGFFTDVKKSQEHTKNSKIVEFYGKLPLINTEKFIIPNTKINLKFTMNSDDYLIVEDSADSTYTESKLKIHNIALYVKSYKCRDTFNMYLEKTLNSKNNAVYEFKSGIISSCAIPTNTINYSMPSLINSKTPSIAIFALVPNDVFNENRKVDQHVYSHNNLENFSFLVNGIRNPCTPYEIKNSDSEKKYARLFQGLFSAMNISHESLSFIVNYDNYMTDYFLIAHDFRNFTGAVDLREFVSDISLGVDLKFSVATTKPLIAIIYSLTHKTFEISSNRVCTVIE